MTKSAYPRLLPIGYLLTAIVIPLFLRKDLFLLNMAIMSGIYAILTTSLRLTFITGIWNLGQAAFYSIGAYTLVLIMQRISISFWLCLPLVAVLALVIALLLGPITLRVKGVYFCILSLSFVEVTRLTYIYTRSANDRVMRASPIPPIAIGNLLKIDFSADRLSFYYLVLFFVVLTMIFLSRVDRSRLGQILRSIEKNELLAQSVGVNTLFYKVVAFAICSFFAGLAGGLFATYNVVITPTSFTSWLSMLFIVHIVVGGLNSTYGPAVGTMLLTVLPEYLPFDPLEIKIVYGLLLILTVSLLPAGLTSIPERIKAYSLKRKLKKASIT